MTAERRLAYLPWAGEHDHLALQIGSNKVVEVTFHIDYSIVYWDKIATFLHNMT
jgi:hypothetical protein